METKQLQYFLTLAQQEHVSSTAQFFNISQPALSKSIHNLEKELGVELFDRIGNRIQLNQYGKDFAEYVEKSLASLQTGIHLVHQNRYDMRGRIKIICHTFADGIVDCVSEYMRLNPQIRVYMFQSQKSNDNLAGQVDFLLNAHSEYGRSDNETWISQVLFQEDSCILISPRYRQYPDTVHALSLLDLKDDWFVSDLFSEDVFHRSNLLSDMCNKIGFEPKVSFHTEDFITKIRMVDQGHGVTVLPRSCLRVAQKLAPDLQIFSIAGCCTQRTVSLMRKRDHQLSEAGLDFWNFVRDYYAPE